jgi:hypothetical protein
MGDLTKNFSLHEFACKCGRKTCRHKEAVHFTLVLELQRAVDHFTDSYGAKVRCTITSGNRCPEHNREVCIKLGVPVAEYSKHTYLCGADHYFEVCLGGGWVLIPSAEVYAYYDRRFPDSCGLKDYGNRVHFDTRATKWRSS